MHFLSLHFALIFIWFCFYCKAGTYNALTKSHSIYEKYSHSEAFRKRSLHFPYSSILTQRTFHIYFCFPSHHLLLPPAKFPYFWWHEVLGTEQGQLSPGSTTLSVIPFPLPVWGSITREPLITEAALDLLHCGTISILNLYLFNSRRAMSKGVQSQCPYSSCFANSLLRIHPLAAVIIMTLLIPPGKLRPQSCLSWTYKSC